MLFTFALGTTLEEGSETLAWLESQGHQGVLIPAPDRLRLIVLTPISPDITATFLPGVEKITPLFTPFKLASREGCPVDTIVKVADVAIGGKQPVIIAGPCAVENLDQTRRTAEIVKRAGATILRGGAYKPRTSPYSFQGLGEEGLEILAQVGAEFQLPIVTEVVSVDDLPVVSSYAAMLQIGARNMQNFALLTAAGETGLPILLKRGLSATIEEWLMAAEYILRTGNRQVVLCERGIRTFETTTRNTLDLSAVTAAKLLSHLPVIADPSHGTGIPQLILPLSRAAIATGAAGVMVEVHSNPNQAQCDGFQALTGAELSKLVADVQVLSDLIAQLNI